MPDDVKDQQQTAVAQRPERPLIADNSTFQMLLDTNKFAQLQRVGSMYAKSKMVPQHFQGDEASCMVAVQMAMRLDVDPFMFLQKTYVVAGKPGMEATLVIALINTRGPFKGPIDWNLDRDDKGNVIKATAFATHRETGRVCSADVTWAMVQAEGWDKKSGSKWNTLREQMFKYRSATFLGRLYCPEVLMGMAEANELLDEAIEVNPEPERPRKSTLKERAGVTVGGEATRVSEAEPDGGGQPEPAREPAPKPADTPPAAQASAGATQAPEPTPTPAEAPKTAPEPAKRAPAIPFNDVFSMAKKAKNREQGDIVKDALRDPGYTEDQRAEVMGILNSKKYPE